MGLGLAPSSVPTVTFSIMGITYLLPYLKSPNFASERDRDLQHHIYHPARTMSQGVIRSLYRESGGLAHTKSTLGMEKSGHFLSRAATATRNLRLHPSYPEFSQGLCNILIETSLRMSSPYPTAVAFLLRTPFPCICWYPITQRIPRSSQSNERMVEEHRKGLTGSSKLSNCSFPQQLSSWETETFVWSPWASCPTYRHVRSLVQNMWALRFLAYPPISGPQLLPQRLVRPSAEPRSVICVSYPPRPSRPPLAPLRTLNISASEIQNEFGKKRGLDAAGGFGRMTCTPSPGAVIFRKYNLGTSRPWGDLGVVFQEPASIESLGQRPDGPLESIHQPDSSPVGRA
ncbi:hypothetical protein SODALDRAFT_379450 [Sodiomyces alkalinus F11]|uniref:Uncharacterized protein n=1 Tax=Sodiomyces alkalinus (strain CBS 110278 / VKM F-3762 / F11) TaxID=1314773 RepID=A0A3N2PV88_SODAK|nr:hypothetical protein SODALDRAFT_379450 [Sodiomyces alkalinus F11]ROT38256.1 hypothetical protein SODALDRAFT_379450 [Sodiomyces alkalinus F11]